MCLSAKMKIDPLNLILEKSFNFGKNFYFITGNEVTLMDKIREKILLKTNSDFSGEVERVKDIGDINNQLGLFEKRRVYITNSTTKIEGDILDKVAASGNFIIFFCENSPKSRLLKNIFLKRNDSYLIECYEISKENKIKLLNNFLNEKKIKINENVYWELIDRLDTRYAFLENELEKINNINNDSLSHEVLNKIFTKNNFGYDKIFFDILSSNQKLVNIYNQKITNQNEVSDFYYSFRQMCLLILNNENELEFSKKIPRYLFKEKAFLIGIYKKYDQTKKNALANLLYETENNFRKNSQLSISLGLRFLLIFKKITIS